MSVANIRRIRSGLREVSTAVDIGYSEILIRKGLDAADSTIALSVEEAVSMIESIRDQISYIDHLRGQR